MTEVRFSLDETGVDDILSHLQACDRSFIPPLSERSDITEYAAKLAANASRFEAWIGAELTGLIAAYCNSSDRQVAYISSVSVLSRQQGKGIAAELLARCIERSNRLGFRQINLDVNSDNIAATGLYKRFGFASVSVMDNVITMTMNLQKDIQ